MLESLHVKNLALMEECEIDFREGLNVLTGETGAGKSILLGSINLALGAKADKDVIRTGETEASVELVFSGNDETMKMLADMDIPSDDNTIIIVRRITPTKSVFKINGETVLQKQVKELSAELIDIHGQHEHQSLLNVLRQRDMIDAFGGEDIEKAVENVAVCCKAYKECLSKLREAEEKGQSRDREISLLEYECKEIEDAELVVGEDEELEEQYKRMVSSEKLIAGVNEAVSLISGENGSDAGELISHAIGSLSRLEGIDDRISSLLEPIREAESLLGDFSLNASNYIDDLEYDPEEFDRVEKRLDLLNTLKSKFGKTLEAVLTYYEEKSQQLQNLRNLDEYLCKLKEEANGLHNEYISYCNKLTLLRKKAGEEFSKQLTRALSELNFNGIEFYVNLETDMETISTKGQDSLEFMISTNPGEPVKPVRNVASGGELSRIMLGIKTILADKDAIDSLIFDEIDAGISGHTAWEVGKKLNKLSKEHQVICISHLPQIAAMSDIHFMIEKMVTDGKTKTEISKLSEDGTINELARLLGGDENSPAAIINAKELRSNALAEKITR